MRIPVILALVIVSACIPLLASAQSTLGGTTGGSLGSTGDGGTTGSSLGQTGNSITLLNPLNIGDCSPNSNCLMNFLNKILEFVVLIGTVIVILMMVFVGYKFVAARGNPAKIDEAKTMLLWTVVGALILLGAQVIAEGIKATVQAIGS